MDTEVFEIREYLDDEGNEVRSEVVSLDNAVKELEESELVDKFKEFAERASKAQPPAGPTPPAPTTAPTTAPPPTDPKSIDGLLDQHDWDGINARAKEIEAAKEQELRKKEQDRAKLEGSGWKKGFFNSHPKQRAPARRDNEPAPSYSEPPARAAADGREKKHVRFQQEAAPPANRHITEQEAMEYQEELVNMLRQSGLSGPMGPCATPPEAANGAATRPLMDDAREALGPAFTGAVSERAGGQGKGGVGQAPVQELQRPPMSRFKARRLGLLRDDGPN